MDYLPQEHGTQLILKTSVKCLAIPYHCKLPIYQKGFTKTLSLYVCHMIDNTKLRIILKSHYPLSFYSLILEVNIIKRT